MKRFLQETKTKNLIKICEQWRRYAYNIGITSGDLDFEIASPKVQDEEAAFADNLLVNTISDSSHSGFVDDSDEIQWFPSS